MPHAKPMPEGSSFNINPPKGREARETTGDVVDIIYHSAVNSAMHGDIHKFNLATAISAAVFDSVGRHIARGVVFNVEKIKLDVFYAILVECAKNGVMLYIGTKAHSERIKAMPNGTVTSGFECPIQSVKSKAAREYVDGSCVFNGNIMPPTFTYADRLRNPKFATVKRKALINQFVNVRKAAFYIVDTLLAEHRRYLATRNGRPFASEDVGNHRTMVGCSLGKTFAEIESRMRMSEPQRIKQTDFVKKIKAMKELETAPYGQLDDLRKFFNDLCAHRKGKIKGAR